MLSVPIRSTFWVPAVSLPIVATAPPVDLVGLLPAVLAAYIADAGEKTFRARQLWHWIYCRGATSFAAMTDLPNVFRSKLAERFIVSRPQVSQELVSSDLTRKWALRFTDGQKAETVYIPKGNRGTVCLSSQVGCTLTCRFCHTGTQKLARNLTVSEIIGQFLVVRDSCGAWPHVAAQNHCLSNVVVMGMGEPLFNYDNVITALKILMDPDGIALSSRRVTLSTAGVVPMIRRLGKDKDIDCNLAVSLHAATDGLRNELMPINKKYPLAVLMAACRDYLLANKTTRPITFEYILLGELNDSEVHANAVVQLVRGIPCKFNLIPFNAWPGAPPFYTSATGAATNRFAMILKDAGYPASIRLTRGQDIFAACGQLRSISLT